MAAITNNDLKENTIPANGTNPGAVEQAVQHAVAQGNSVDSNGKQRKVADWVSVNATLQLQSLQGVLKLKRDVNIQNGTTQIKAPAGTVVRLFKRNADSTIFQGMICDEHFNQMCVTYQIPADSIVYPNPAAADAPRQRASQVNDELASAAIKAAAKVGSMPTDETSKSKTAEEWRKIFPGCTIENISVALIAIDAFRTNRAGMIIAAKDTTTARAAILEYRRAKSWEQDVFSTAKNCGIL